MEGQLQKHPRISINPKVCHGKPVIVGTRIIVSQLLGALSGGSSREELLLDYASIKAEDIDAALAFASELSLFEEVPLPNHG